VGRAEPGTIRAVGDTRYPQLITVGWEPVKSVGNAVPYCIYMM
jgi:hypothetical protein